MSTLDRRHFLGASLAAGLGLPHSVSAHAVDHLVVGVMGTGGRGLGLAQQFASLPDVTLAYVCDVDPSRLKSAAAAVEKKTGNAPKAVGDFRKILDDKDVNVLVIAAPNHWHAPAAILACSAGKHVYVEKPCSHDPHEGELLVAAADKFDRRVQMGNQRRSWPKVIEAAQQVRDGVIGRAYLAQSWYQNNRGSIGRGKATEPPAGLDYELWQGPAPRKPFRSNYLHYNWHWFWNWGNGELGNNGIHMLDLCRWGLGVDYPTRVTSSGGRYAFEDDQETPDTHVAAFEFEGRKSIRWEGLSCMQRTSGRLPDVVFIGEKGTLEIQGGTYTVYDPNGKELHPKESGDASEKQHFSNFLDAVRGKVKLNSEIEEGHKSTLLCHLGNIAHRTGRVLRCDQKDGKILDDKEAMALWTREYPAGWEPKV